MINSQMKIYEIDDKLLDTERDEVYDNILDEQMCHR